LAARPSPAASRPELTGSYGVAKPSGVVAVTGGVATGVCGADGAVVVVVAVSPTVAEGVSDTSEPDGAWTAPRATVNPPAARTAPAPAVAHINFTFVESTCDHSNSISSRK
jgi:hypothetical protein